MPNNPSAKGEFKFWSISDNTTLIWNVNMPTEQLGIPFVVYIGDPVGDTGYSNYFTVAPGDCTSATTTTTIIATQSQTTSQISALPGTTSTSIDERKASQTQASRYASPPQFDRPF